MDFKVVNTGYSNSQVIEGYMEINIGLEHNLIIDVHEITKPSGNEVKMFVDFRKQYSVSPFFKKAVLDKIRLMYLEHEDYEIDDENLIEELFSQYGNNFSK